MVAQIHFWIFSLMQSITNNGTSFAPDLRSDRPWHARQPRCMHDLNTACGGRGAAAPGSFLVGSRKCVCERERGDCGVFMLYPWKGRRAKMERSPRERRARSISCSSCVHVFDILIQESRPFPPNILGHFSQVEIR